MSPTYRLALAAAFGVSLTAAAQPAADFAPLDRYFDTLAAHDRAMGTLHVLRGDSTVYSRAIGMAALEPATPATPATRYRVGSITKSYTAAVVMRLVEEGKLSLDDALAEHFPNVPNAADVTVRQLLSHRSGLNSVTDDPTYLTWKDAPVSRDSMLARMARRPAAFAPGAQFGYSNSNYILLTYLIEDLTGGTYAEALETYVLAPLSLNHTTADELVALADSQALSYSWSPAAAWALESDTDPSVPRGAGAIAATAEEVARFYRGLFAGRVVSETSLAQMTDLAADGMRMGLGLFAMPYGNRLGYGHTGGIDGFRSQAAYWPDDTLAVAWLSNAARTTPNEVMLAALAAYHGREVEIPNFNVRAVEADPDYLASLTGTYVSLDFPLDIVLTADGGTLTAQATGQGAFPLEAREGGVFAFDGAGIRMQFPEPGVMDFAQGPMKLRFTRE